jgi:hypothetical protein
MFRYIVVLCILYMRKLVEDQVHGEGYMTPLIHYSNSL